MILTVFSPFDPFAHRVSALRGSLHASWQAPSMLLESPLPRPASQASGRSAARRMLLESPLHLMYPLVHCGSDAQWMCECRVRQDAGSDPAPCALHLNRLA